MHLRAETDTWDPFPPTVDGDDAAHRRDAHRAIGVSVAFAARGVFAWRHVPGYLAAELSGALLSAGVLHFLFHPTAHEGVNHPSGGVEVDPGVVEIEWWSSASFVP